MKPEVKRAGLITQRLIAARKVPNLATIQKGLKIYFSDNNRTFKNGTPDGKWGEETYEAVKAWQADAIRNNYLAAKNKRGQSNIDGVYGPATHAAVVKFKKQAPGELAAKNKPASAKPAAATPAAATPAGGAKAGAKAKPKKQANKYTEAFSGKLMPESLFERLQKIFTNPKVAFGDEYNKRAIQVLKVIYPGAFVLPGGKGFRYTTAQYKGKPVFLFSPSGAGDNWIPATTEIFSYIIQPGGGKNPPPSFMNESLQISKKKILKMIREELQYVLDKKNTKTIEEGKDPAKGTGKKPKGSGRRLYTDENPKDTVSVKFSSASDVRDTFSKQSFKNKSHKRQSQIINLVHQRARAAYKNAKDPKVKARLKKAFEYAKKRKEASKRKTKRMNKK